MVTTGARADTWAALTQAISVPATFTPVELAERLKTRIIPAKRSNLEIANRVFTDRRLQPATEFRQLLKQHFAAQLEQVDFERAPTAAETRINAWTRKATHGLIPRAVPEGAIDLNTIMVLVNTAHFRGLWQERFEPSNTKREPFLLASGESVQVPLMHAKLHCRYTELTGAFGAQVLELPYRDSDLALLLVLPAPGQALTSVEQALTADTFHGWVASLQRRFVNVALPRFTIISPMLDLRRPLKELGAEVAFDCRRANFTGLVQNPPQGSCLSFVYHQARIAVDEQGTVAAAATAVGMRGRSAGKPRIIEFRADRPFLFFLYDRALSALHFMGRLENPMEP